MQAHSTIRRRLAVLVAAAALALSSGCSHTSRIDPTGQRVFTYDTPYTQVPGPPDHHDRTAVMVTPAKIIAPVNTEVVVQAAVCGEDKVLMAGEPVEWSIAPNSVGYFVQAGEASSLEFLHHVAHRTRKVDNTFAVSSTSPKFVMLNRGTPETGDDVPVLRGQAWATVSSPTEGTSFVSAFAPRVRSWSAHKQTTTIYWVDCQWTFPPPAINPAGSRHTFTTLLTKYSNKCPLAGYRVRYEITGGPAAGFAPNGSQVIEVTSNTLGQAPVEIFQQAAAPGTNTISIQVIRPADWPGGDGTQLTVGTGTTQKTWTSGTSGLLIDKSGPAEVQLGGTVNYRIDIRNPSDLTARGLTVTDAVPNGLTLIGTNPQATANGTTLTWQLGDLPAGQARTIELSFRAQTAGVVNNCATVASLDGATAQDCAATTITTPTVELTMTAPPQAAVGEFVNFSTIITNRGSTQATNLVLIDRFDPGLKHEYVSSPIENRELGTLQPGESRPVNVRLQVLQPGRWCNSMELTGDNGIRGSAQACVIGVAATSTVTPPVVPTPPPSTPAAGGALPVIVVTKTPEKPRAKVDDLVLFTITVENRGTAPATDLKLLDTYDLGVIPEKVSEGALADGNNIYWLIPALQPNETIVRRVQSRCRAPGPRVCNKATVTCREVSPQSSDGCLEITGRDDALTVNITDAPDPVRVGDEIVYTVTVQNGSAASEFQVQVSVTVPGEATPSGGGNSAIRSTVDPADNRTVRFDPIAEMLPGDTITLQVRAIARQPGSAVARARAISRTQQGSNEATTSTTVRQ